jgi:predicted DNA-binding antitoxin AbrB/MazE fold protein
MKKSINVVLVVMALLSMTIFGCSNRQKENGDKNSTKQEITHDEHSGHVHEGSEGEESGIKLAIDDVYDEVRKGTHLVLSFDIEASEFVGTVENVSDQILDRVRVEVHLSNGTELGPTTQVDLKPGEKREVLLTVESDDFDGWSTHAEVGSSEHSHEGEHEHQ